MQTFQINTPPTIKNGHFDHLLPNFSSPFLQTPKVTPSALFGSPLPDGFGIYSQVGASVGSVAPSTSGGLNPMVIGAGVLALAAVAVYVKGR